jgi:hypothetical protein
MANGSPRASLDRYGMALSIGCAIHCAVLPIALSAMTTAGLAWVASEELEWTILICTFLIGSTRLVQSYFQHRHTECLILFVAGLVSFVCAKSELFDFPYNEAVFMTIGGLLIAIAHFRNLRLSRTCCAPAA